MYLASALIVGGIALMGWGFPASHALKSPWDRAAALAVPAGVVLALTGTLLATVPGFFQG